MKSNVSDHLEMMEAVYIDATIKCIADVFDLRDLETLRSRVKNEGFSFLTITLPNFCSDFERSLANGFIDSTSFQGFRKLGSIPAFLRGMISQIFDQKTGRIYDELHEDAPTIVESVRQICLTFKKVEVNCSAERLSTAITSFKDVEQSLQLFSVPEEEYTWFTRVSSVLWGNMLYGISPSECEPKHGPGATAEGISGNQKFVWRSWHERLEPFFPIIHSGFPIGIPVDSRELEKVTFIPEDQERPVRVVFVPKTLKSPRVIAIEPCCMQYTQQGIREILYRTLESDRLTSGHVNFARQDINQDLAISASATGLLATIDLSDASDRVPRDLALEMFHSNPDLRDAIDACRSTRAELPSGEIISLKKFASMGSALCFPIEAMYFYTICVVALLRENNLPVTYANCFKVSRDVHVYGDDIIVPATNASAVIDHLQKYNCKVNTRKSFWTGKFRESCGVDAFDGYPVTPVYLRQLCPDNRRQAENIVSWVETANLFYKKGYWRVATFMFNKLERIIGRLPYVSETSQGLGRVSFLGYRTVDRWNSKLQRFEFKSYFPSPVYRKDSLEGYAALSASFARSSRRPCGPPSWSCVTTFKELTQPTDPLHMDRSVVHHALALRHGWLPSQF